MYLKIGSYGDNVKKVQEKLDITVDGIFGSQTQEKVIEFQKNNGLLVDGIVGNTTWSKMFTKTQVPVNNNPITATTSNNIKSIDKLYKFNVEKKDIFTLVGSTDSIPSQYYITEYIEDVTSTHGIGDEYTENKFTGEEEVYVIPETALRIDEYVYSSDIHEYSGDIDYSSLSGAIIIPQAKKGKKSISKNWLRIIKGYEGSIPYVYDDSTAKPISDYSACKGYPTIGVGHRIDNNQKNYFAKYLKGKSPISENEIINLLIKDAQSRVDFLNKKITKEITQNQFDALLSFFFNCGKHPKLLEAISALNGGRVADAAKAIRNGPTISKGKVYSGLVARRKAEAELIIT